MKNITIPVIIIITFLIIYYFIFFLPSQKQTQTDMLNQKAIFEKQTECMQICKTLYEYNHRTFSEYNVLNPNYSYNKDKNACFYSGGWINAENKSLNKSVVNCQTNEEVLTYIEMDGNVVTNFCDTCASSNDEYIIKEKQYIQE